MFIDPTAVMNVQNTHNGIDGGAISAAIQIKIWMMRKNMTASSVAREIGVSRPTVSMWIAGRKRSQTVWNFFQKEGLPEFLLTERVSKKRASSAPPSQSAEPGAELPFKLRNRQDSPYESVA